MTPIWWAITLALALSGLVGEQLDFYAKSKNATIVAALTKEELEIQLTPSIPKIKPIADSMGLTTQSESAENIIWLRRKVNQSEPDGGLVALLEQSDLSLAGQTLSLADLKPETQAWLLDLLEKEKSPLCQEMDLKIEVCFEPYIAVIKDGEVVERLFLAERNQPSTGRFFQLYFLAVSTPKVEKIELKKSYQLNELIEITKTKATCDKQFQNLPVVFFGQAPEAQRALELGLRLHGLVIRDGTVKRKSVCDFALYYSKTVNTPFRGVTSRVKFGNRDLNQEQREYLSLLLRDEGIEPSEALRYEFVPSLTVNVFAPTSSHVRSFVFSQ